MSIEFQVTETLPGTPERVFQALTDLEAAAQWMPGCVGIERMGDVQQGVGMRWRETRSVRGREATMEFEVTHHHSPSHLGLRMSGGDVAGMRGEFHYRLAQRVGGTEVRLTGKMDGVMPRGLGWMGSLLAPVFKRECAKDLHALAEHLRQPETVAAVS